MSLGRYWLCAGIAALAGCGGAQDASPPPAPVAGTVAERPQPACSPGSVKGMRTDRLAYAAVVRDSATAYRRPGRGPLARFDRLNVNGVPNVLGALAAVRGADCEPRWYRVQLPRKPNGVEGYVRAEDVEIVPVRTRIVVDLSDRRVTLFRRGRAVVSARAAIGSSATPTPTGDYYVNQRLIPYDTSGPFGPGAIGISAFSEVLTGWAQGGPVAIHGTNAPWSIGQAVSNGCIRVRNDLLKRMFDQALPGTPVEVRA